MCSSNNVGVVWEHGIFVKASEFPRFHQSWFPNSCVAHNHKLFGFTRHHRFLRCFRFIEKLARKSCNVLISFTLILDWLLLQGKLRTHKKVHLSQMKLLLKLFLMNCRFVCGSEMILHLLSSRTWLIIRESLENNSLSWWFQNKKSQRYLPSDANKSVIVISGNRRLVHGQWAFKVDTFFHWLKLHKH